MSFNNQSCLYSTIKNTSSNTMRFGFLPPHGVQLAANEEYTVFGHILEAINEHGDRGSNQRNHQAFVAALNRGDITIISTPSPVLVDATSGLSKILHLASGALSAVATCWAVSDSLFSDVPV